MGSVKSSLPLPRNVGNVRSPVCFLLLLLFLIARSRADLDMIRCYTKPKGQDVPDYSDPVMLMKRKSTVEDFCRKIHKSLADQFKFAWVWGTSVKHEPQKVGMAHQLEDEDVVQIIKKM